MSRIPLNRGIRFKLLGATLGILSTAVLIFCVFTIQNQRIVLNNSLVGKGHSLSTFIAKLSVDPILKNDIVQLDAIVREVNLDRDVAYALIQDEEGQILTTSFSSINFHAPEVKALAASPAATLTENIASLRKTRGIIELAVPIQIDKSTIGTLFLGLSESRNREQIERMGYSVLVLAGGVLFAALYLSVKTQKVITRPIFNLMGLMEHISRERDYSARAPIQSRDEMGALAQGFNDMLEHVQSRDAELKFHRNHLEELVAERTTALAETNKRLQLELQERTRAERALAESEEHLQDIVNSVHSGIILIAAQTHRIVSVNSFAAALIGLRKEEIVGRVCHNFFCPALEKKCPITDMGQTIDNTERALLRADGTSLAVLKSVVPIRYRGQDLLMESFIDISALKLAEETLKKYTEQLQRSNQDLQEFAYVASHDLQEPLRKVQSFGERLESKFGPLLQEQGCDYLARMRNASGRMQVLINDLLSFSRLTTKAQPFAQVDLSRTAREVLLDLEARIEQSGGSVAVGELPVIDADPLQMRQLLQNLIGNALKFHRPEEPPRVAIAGRILEGPKELPGQPAANGRWCRITVTDNGIGFEEEYRDRIFVVFQRLHGRDKYPGTGVGLAICKKIAERHGGTITAQSIPGQGSTFIVTLPVAQSKESGRA